MVLLYGARTEPFQYLQQNNGDIAAEIKPTSDLIDTPSSGGKIEFGWHTDDCFFNQKFRTTWIMLAGYFNPDDVRTSLASIDDIITQLDDKNLSILMSKRFKVRVPISICKDEYYRDNMAIIRINGSQEYEIGTPIFDTIPMVESDIEAFESLETLINAANKVAYNGHITDDAILIFNNDKFLHARAVIPNDRLILRIYIRDDLKQLRLKTLSNGNVFDSLKLL